ncbi:MAG: Lar family restriction alleviation protein [Bacteroidaceae bacterium]|nr:Lar family restriction alleviation protein [Bacteroidaceae bacterium]
MSEIKLLPCPFCGGEAEVIGHYIKAGANNFQYFVRCKKCKARPQPFYTFKKKEKAVEVWNTRKPMERILERLEEASFWTEQTFDEDGYGNDDSWEAVWLDKAIEIVKEEGLK